MPLLSVLFRLPVLPRAEGRRAKSSEFNVYHLGMVDLVHSVEHLLFPISYV